MPNLLSEVFARLKKPSPKELGQVVVEIKKLQQHHGDTRSQGYYDRLQRASSWLAKAKQIVDDPEAQFIFLWIALNALCGVRYDVLKTAWWRNEERSRPTLYKEQGDDLVLRELEWFLWRVCGLDGSERTLRSVIEDHWPDVKTVIKARYIMSYHRNGSWRSEEHIDRRMKSSMRIVNEAIGLVSGGEKMYRALCEIIIWRLRTLRNQLFHGCATDAHSKRRVAGESELEAGSRLLEELIWAFLVLLAGESGRVSYWPPSPYPRAGSPQHQPFDASWLPK